MITNSGRYSGRDPKALLQTLKGFFLRSIADMYRKPMISACYLKASTFSKLRKKLHEDEYYRADKKNYNKDMISKEDVNYMYSSANLRSHATRFSATSSTKFRFTSSFLHSRTFLVQNTPSAFPSLSAYQQAAKPA